MPSTDETALLLGLYWRWTPADATACRKLADQGFDLVAGIVAPVPDDNWRKAVEAALNGSEMFSRLEWFGTPGQLAEWLRSHSEVKALVFDQRLPEEYRFTPDGESYSLSRVEDFVCPAGTHDDFLVSGEYFSLQHDCWTEVWHQIDRQPEERQEVLSLWSCWLYLHKTNFNLWHAEDEARRTRVPHKVIAKTKRTIDQLNQHRNDLIEHIDEIWQKTLLQGGIEGLPDFPAESMGSLCDRLSILSLKMYHMAEQSQRKDVSADHRQRSLERLEVLRAQRAHLERAFDILRQDLLLGRCRPVVYRQFKMYNDPTTNPALYSPRRNRR